MASNRRKKREKLRDTLWPGIVERTYPRPPNLGWCPVPRTMPQVLQLLSDKHVGRGMDLTRTYLGLWCDNFGDGMVEIADEADYASVAGFKGERGLRSWRDRVKALRDAGFIETIERGSKKVGFVCIIDPHLAVMGLLANGFKPPIGWIADYSSRLLRSGSLAMATTEDINKYVTDQAKVDVVETYAQLTAGRGLLGGEDP
jgi:hypothetical protein